MTRLNPWALYACLTSLQLRALLSAADDRDSSTDAIEKATCSLHIAHIGGTRGESAARAPAPIKKSRLRERLLSFLQKTGFHNKKRREKLLTLGSCTSTSLPKRRKKRPPVFSHRSSVRNKPARPDSSKRDQILLKEGSLVAGAQLLVPHTQRCSRLSEEGRNAPETGARRRAERTRAGPEQAATSAACIQGRALSCAFTHPR